MSRIIKIILGLVLLSLIRVGFAQEQQQTNYLSDIVPPPPEATSLGKFVEIPVSHYTGIPTIQVPIYSIDLDGLKIPISLSYHAKGVKVSEIAPRVGIGWALNAGGSIIRQTRGPSDDGIYGHLNTSHYRKLFEKEDYKNLDGNIISRIQNDEIGDKVDLYPDLFIFNFLGYSGKFIFDSRTRLPVLQEFSDIKIQPVYTGEVITGWVIKTPNGFRAHFDVADKEVITNRYGYVSGALGSLPKSPTINFSSWNLTALYSPSGKTIHFNYEEEEPIYIRRTFDRLEDDGPASYFSKIKGIQHNLKEVIFPQGQIKLVRSSVLREDLQSGGYALDSIIIQDKNQKTIKSYKLNYSYSNNRNLSNVLDFIAAIDSSASKRLFLDSIQEIAANPVTRVQTIKPYYRFEYINKNELPNRFSNAQDLWGYYNGKNNGKFLTVFDYGAHANNRRVDTLKVQTGLLNKVTFPTGGYALYEYEANRAIPPTYFKQLYYPDPNPLSLVHGTGMLKDRRFWSGSDYRKSFQIVKTQKAEIASIYTSINVSSPENCSSIGSINCSYDFYIEDKATQKAVVKLANGKTKISLKPGEYTLVAKPKRRENVDDSESSFFAFSVHWNYRVGGNILYTSGNRIKKITLNDGENNTITKTYEYKDLNGRCSGKVFSLPFYFYVDDSIEGIPVIDYNAKLGARPGSPISYHQGNHAGYSRVTEYKHGINGQNSKTAYEFTTISDGGMFYTHPHTLAKDHEWLRGKLLKKTYFKKFGDSYVPIKETVNEYEYGSFIDYAGVQDVLSNAPSENYKVSNPKTGHLTPLITAGRSRAPGAYTLYFLSSGTQHLRSTKEKIFENGLSFSKTADFSYSYDNHYQKTESKTTTSNGKTIIKKLYYPDDVTSATSLPGGSLSNAEFQAIKRLQAPTKSNPYGQHRIGEVVQEVTEVADVEGSATVFKRNNYANWGNNKILPKSVQTLKGSTTSTGFEERAVFHRYDSHANPLEVSQKDGMHTVYLYGYSKQNIIAQIQNVTFSEVATALGVSENALEKFNENHLAQINGLRSQKPEWMITTYTHIPLVGVKAATDPKGLTTTYEYDDFNRLKHIKDHNGDILEAYDYHYKNE